MDKITVDKFIASFMKTAYNFSSGKTTNIHEAEEIASMIIYEVYLSLLKQNNVQSIEAYSFRIAQNVYAKYIDDNKRKDRFLKEGFNAIADNEVFYDFKQEEQYLHLRSEIAYLAEIQRNILVMHFFEHKKIEDISKNLNLPIGTVKYHLHETRNILREKINMGSNETIDIKPIRFTKTWCSGSLLPSDREIKSYPNRLLSQNILYLVYNTAKTSTEIARELGIGTAYVEDEISYLLNYDFLVKLSREKYRTNILIDCTTEDQRKQKKEIFARYAKQICEKYMPLLFDTFKKYDCQTNEDGCIKDFYAPENDINYFLWAIVNFACSSKLYYRDKKHDLRKFYIDRIDGSRSIIHASLNNHYGPLYFHDKNNVISVLHYTGSLCLWNLDYLYIEEKDDYSANITDFENLFDYLAGKMTKNIFHIAKFKRLYDNELLVVRDHEYEYMNLVAIRTDFTKGKPISSILPELPKGFKKIYNCLGEELFDFDKKDYPKHLHEMYRALCHHSFGFQDMKNAITDYLCENNYLKPLNDIQKINKNKIMFFSSDVQLKVVH